MRTRHVGRLSLQLDSIYCAVAAVSLILFVGPVSERTTAPPVATVAIAVAVGGWAFALHRVARRPRLRGWLVGVLVANVVAAAAIATVAATRPWDGAFTVLLAAVAVEVAAFAVSQAVALRRDAPGV
ncbi:hypothetical protein QTQ03_07005 [Micromonospora sp. WMMA1363]|uniref:hypothetical protein n=1 Tax=Micromonospora sp. WMMA1363 TaxID=3053985 RepID=UPI00259C7844|nr:hypothetical protein [Micromonospora sp. WMMA1363]MDM4719356.1 hypothetical protein [Micromonospora sp. WMMA1363]